MKKGASLNLFLILSTSIILSSCGGGNSKPKLSFSVDNQLLEEAPLTTTERNIATRICYAYQTKSQNFRTPEFLGGRFVFSTKKTDCQGLVNSVGVTTAMNYDALNELSYIVPAPIDPNFLFNKKVQTDTSGYLAQLCPKILTNQTVSNTTTIQNVKAQISFFSDETDNMDGFFIQYFNLQPDNSFKIDSAERFKVPASEASVASGNIKGMDHFYSTQKRCSAIDKNKFSDFEQTFISR